MPKTGCKTGPLGFLGECDAELLEVGRPDQWLHVLSGHLRILNAKSLSLILTADKRDHSTSTLATQGLGTSGDAVGRGKRDMSPRRILYQLRPDIRVAFGLLRHNLHNSGFGITQIG